MTKRNDKVRSAIQFIVECQRGSSSDWFSLYDWVDLIDATLKVTSQWGSNCLVWNRQIGVMLSKHPAFSKYYYRKSQIQIPMYKIDLNNNMTPFERSMSDTWHRAMSIIMTTPKFKNLI